MPLFKPYQPSEGWLSLAKVNAAQCVLVDPARSALLLVAPSRYMSIVQYNGTRPATL